MPADILLYLKENCNAVDVIRKQKEYMDYIGGIIYGKEKNWNKKRIFRKSIKW